MRILIADDDPVPRRMLQAILKKWDYEVVVATNGAEAWEILQSENAPPLAILDWLMPEMDGVEVCRRMRLRTDAPYVYFILLTSKDRKEDIIEGMEAGADDYLIKPFETHRLQVRLRAGRRILDLQAALLSSVGALAQAREREVEIGARIQQTLLLGQPPSDPQGVSVAALTIPSQQIDGDFYDFFQHAERGLDVIVGDVMGKGVPAALFGAAVKSQFMRALSSLICARMGEIPDPEQIVAAVHAEVTRQFIGLDSFMTLCYARFDPRRRNVTFVDCGHTKTIHLRPSTGELTTLEGDSLPLGVSEREVYTQVVVAFEEGDLFCFYSDGVTEARSESGELFGFDRLADAVRANGHLAPGELVGKIRQAVVEFSNATVFADDLTCVAVSILPMPPDSAVEPSDSDGDAAVNSGAAVGQEPSQSPSKHHSPAAAPPAANEEVLAHSRLLVSSALPELRSIRAFVRDFCRVSPGTQMIDDSLNELELAVNEAASNIMRHAYEGRTDEVIRVEADAFADRVEIRLYNSGIPYDASQARPPSFDGTRDGGFGVYMIANSVDRVAYFRDADGWNGLSMVKLRTGRHAERV